MSPAHNILWRLRLSSLVAFLCCCILTSGIHAETSSAEARLTSDRVVEVTPGKIVTASILIANRSGADADYDEQFALPANWRQISPTATPIRLAAGAEQLRLIAFAVPTAAPAGSSKLDYFLTNSRTRSPVANVTVTVVVLPVAKLELTREDQTETVIAGDTYEVTLRVINRGNSRMEISLAAVSAPVCPVRLEASELWLDAGASQLVRAGITTNADLRQTSSQVVNFNATATDHKESIVTARQPVVVKVIPRITGDRDPYVRLPARLRLIGTSEDGRVSSQAEFSGGGHLDEGQKHRIDFLFRGPSLDGEGPYGLRNEYRVNYFGPKLDVYVGDQNYPLSPLTQRFSYGRGAGFAFHPGPTSTGAFCMETMGRTENFQTAGSYVRREFTPTFSLQANALYKTDSGYDVQPTGPLSIFSLQPHFDFGEKLDLDLEYALGNVGSGSEAQAYRAEARGKLFDEVVYSAERVHAGNRFFGAYHATEQTQATITFPIHRSLRGKIAFDQIERDVVTTFSDQPPLPQGVLSTRQTSYRPGLLFRVSPRTDLSLEYQNVTRHVERVDGVEDSLEHSIRIGVGHSREKLSAQTYAEFGTIEKTGELPSGESAERESVGRYSLFLSYRPTARQSYSVYGTLGSSAIAGVTERSRTLGASAQWTVTQQLSASLSYARDEYDARTARVQDTAGGTVGYTLPNHNIVGVQGRWIKNSATQETHTSVLVSYTIPFGMRGLKKKSIGVIRGKVVELNEGRSLPMSRVVVTANGMTAVTNHRGEFIFPSLKPGLYQLNVEQRSLGVDLVTRELFPLTLEVNKEEVVELSLSVVRSARFCVKVAVFAPAQRTLDPGAGASDKALKEVCGLGGGLVELTDGKQVLRQVTRPDGTVAFEHLRPGKWTLRVYQNNLPAHHVIKTPETEIDLKPGQSHQSLVRVVPKVRRIILIDEGSVVPQSR